jgi:beta-galactosidase
MKQIPVIICCLFFAACNNEKPPRERISFNQDWQFFLAAETIDASASSYDDTGWRTLNLPHDWSIEAGFDPNNPAGTGGGALPGGHGWYRKHFKLPETDQGKTIYIDFDGVYRNSSVWINGHLLGFRPNGYVSFRYNLTPYLRYGEEENLLAVHADNAQQPNSRWYSGSGIYRNVWLVKTHPLHVDLWGTFVTTPEVTDEKATVVIASSIRNNSEDAVITVVNRTVDALGKTVSEKRKEITVPARGVQLLTETLSIPHPKRWTLSEPYRYTMVTEIISNRQTVDTYETPFGIRTFRWDPAAGFYLNNEPVKIRGVCMHHDLGCLGTAVNTRALVRQMEILKEMGVNSIRTSHNPPAPELLEICDRMGLLVQNESFDMWRRRKSRYDYAQYFDEWYMKDLTDQILRDRNHPSVFMWSIGNEVLEQWTHAHADTLNLQQANLILNAGHHVDPSLMSDTTMSVQSLITHTLAAVVRKLDQTRAITAGCNEVSPGNHLFRSGALDVYGFNYHQQDFASFPEVFPGKTLLVSESTSGLMSRGIYEMPSGHSYIRPDRWDIPFDLPEHHCSAYDNCHVPWGSTHEASWLEVKKYPHVSGMYVWTGFDYLGEPTPYGWPSRSSFFGIVDLAGIPKDVYYMYQSEWTEKPVLHIFPHWNWKEGQETDIWAYYNQADEVELYLNGTSMGKKSKSDSVLHVCWRLKYTPGTLQAVSRKDGKEVLTRTIRTAGEPAGMELTPDRRTLLADGKDVSFVTVQIKDKDGNPVPDAANLIRFSITAGEGLIAGTDNGNQNDPNSLKKPERHAFSGKAMVVVQNKGKKGNIRLKASSDGLPDAYTDITVVKK